jgi:hypothetical protein
MAAWVAVPAQAALVTRVVGATLNAAAIESYDLDVDLNGTIDFTFTAAFVPDPVLSVGFDTVDVPFASTNGVVIDAATLDGLPTASLLAPGAVVSAASLFSFGSNDQGNLFFFIEGETPTGNFAGRTGFLGLRFESAGGIRFGFAEISVNALDAIGDPLGLTIGLVGYEDVPEGAAVVPAAVPAPGGMPFLVAGCLGLLAAMRRRAPTPGGR